MVWAEARDAPVMRSAMTKVPPESTTATAIVIPRLRASAWAAADDLGLFEVIGAP